MKKLMKCFQIWRNKKMKRLYIIISCQILTSILFVSSHYLGVLYMYLVAYYVLFWCDVSLFFAIGLQILIILLLISFIENKKIKWIKLGEVKMSEKETVNHPEHYNTGKFEVIDVIEDWNLGFHTGNAVKYIARSKHKNNEIEDLKKAIWYLKRYIEKNKK